MTSLERKPHTLQEGEREMDDLLERKPHTVQGVVRQLDDATLQEKNDQKS